MAVLDDRFGDIEEQLASWQEKLDAADARASQILATLETIQPRLTKLEADLTVLQNKATKAKLI